MRFAVFIFQSFTTSQVAYCSAEDTELIALWGHKHTQKLMQLSRRKAMYVYCKTK